MAPASPEYLGQLLATLATASVVLDAQGRVVATSPAWDGLEGTISNAGVGVDYLAVCDRAAEAGDPEAAQAADGLRRLLRGEAELATVVYPCPMPDGLHWFRMIAFMVGSTPPTVLVTHADLGVEAEGPQTAATATMLQMAVHDLANPLTVVLGMLERLSDQGGALSEDQRAVLLAAARRQARRMVEIVEELREVATGRRSAPTPARHPVADAVAEARAVVDGSPEVHVVGDDAAVWADPSHVVRVLANLFENARKYGEEPVTVTVEPRGRRIRISVQDEGLGVPSDVAERLFQLHHRGEGEASTTSGTGLGLAMARDLLARNGGTIRLDTSARGARFVLDLPAAGEDAPSGRA